MEYRQGWAGEVLDKAERRLRDLKEKNIAYEVREVKQVLARLETIREMGMHLVAELASLSETDKIRALTHFANASSAVYTAAWDLDDYSERRLF